MRLCHRPGCTGCPDVHLMPDGKTIEIEDDYGGNVQMTKTEFEQLKKTEIKDL